MLTADNSFECWVNGRRVGEGDRFDQLYVMNVASALKPGTNVVAVAATNGADNPNPAGLIGLLTIRLQDGRTLEIATDQSWEAAEKVAGDWRSAAAADGWAAAMELGPCGMAPWGEPEFTPAVRNVFPDATVIHGWLAKSGVPPDFQRGTPAALHPPPDRRCRRVLRRQRRPIRASRRPARSAWPANSPNSGTPKPAASRRCRSTKNRTAARMCCCGLARRSPCSWSSAAPASRRIGWFPSAATGVSCCGWSRRERLPDARGITNTFTITAWVKPAADTLLPRETREGVTAFTAGRNDVVYPPPGHEVWGEADAGAGLAVGRNGICVHEHGAEHFPAVLVYPAAVTDWTHVAVVYRDGTPSLYVGGKLVRTGLKSRFVVHPGLRVPHTRPVVPFQGQLADLQQFDRALSEAEMGELAKAAPDPAAAGEQPVLDLARGEIWQPGTYRVQDGRRTQSRDQGE